MKLLLNLFFLITGLLYAETAKYYVPQDVSSIPNNEYGQMVKLGRNIFIHTQKYAKRYVGNGLECSSCHLGEGRQAHAAPMWAAYGRYPMFRIQSQKVIQITQRIQGCFKYSMNGMAPTVNAPEMNALISYFSWLSQGVPLGKHMSGQGFPEIKKSRDPSSINGKIVYKKSCALCHGVEGKGQKRADGVGYQFPPLWGTDTFNRKSSLNNVGTMARFVKANMPLGMGFSLTDEEALDVSYYIWIHDKNEDPTRSLLTNTLQPKSGLGN